MISLYNWFKRHQTLSSCIYRFFGRNHYDIAKYNSVNYKSCFIKRSAIRVVGKNNTVLVQGGSTRLRYCSIYISGDNNEIIISSGCLLDHVEIHVEDNSNRVFIDNSVEMYGPVHMAAIESTSISIGRDCLFSQNVIIRTGDSHSIINVETGNRANPSKDVCISNHVWVGHGVTILKGSKILRDSVIAANAVITGKEYSANSIFGGNPAKLLKSGITWDIRRV